VAQAQTAVSTQGASLRSADAGALVVLVASGDLTVNSGSTAVGVQASGNLLLSAAGTVGIESAITSTGSVSVLSTAGNVNVDADITLHGDGTLDVQAAQALVMTHVVSTVGNVSLSATTGDVTLSQVSSAGRVAVQAGGSVLDGDAAVDVTAQGLYVHTGSGGSVGSSSDVLETSVDTLSVTAGSGGVYVVETSGLLIDGVSVQINRVSTSGAAQALAVVDNLRGQLVAAGGGDLSVNVSAGDLSFKAGSQVQATGTGTINLTSADGSVLQEKGSVVSSDAGAVQVSAKDKAQMTNVSTVSGDVGVSSTEGAFEIPAVAPGEVVDYGGKPVRIQSVDVQINAPVVSAGSSFELTLPGQTVNLDTLNSSNAVTVTSIPVGQPLPTTIPFVLGDLMGATTSGVSVDRTEVGFIGSTDPTQQLKSIIVGSQTPGQQILLQSDSQQSGSLVFNAPLVLIASGLLEQGGVLTGSSVKITGDIEGKGLTVYGSGSTITYEGANLVEAGDINLYDSVVVNQNTTLTAVGGDIAIHGKITVKPGVTLTLVANHVTLSSGVFNGVTRGGVVLMDDTSSSTDMATLKITANDLTVDVSVDGGQVGQLIVQGGVLGSGHEAELAALATAMVDNSFAALTLGNSSSALNLGQGSLLAEQADQVTLLGTQVSLSDSSGGTATWALNTGALTVQAGTGDLTVNVALVSSSATNVSLSATSGNVSMTDAAKVRTVGGSLTVQAGGDVVVGELNASTGSAAQVGGVALDSAHGVIRAASANSGLVNAQTVSLYGYGPKVTDLSSQTAVKVQSQQLQVSAPSGQVVRDSGTNGETYYTLIKRNTYYREATVMGTAPTNVVVAKSQVAGNPQAALPQVNQAALLSQAYASQGVSYGLLSMRSAPLPVPTLAGVRSYLAGVMHATPTLSTAVTTAASVSVMGGASATVSTTDLLSDLSYGLSADTSGAFVLGTPGVQTTSAGVKTTPVLNFDYEA
jgi:hypothetical protein